MTIIPGAQRCQLWGSLVSCGRLSIGLARFPSQMAAAANRRAGCHSDPHDFDNRQYFGRTTLASGSVARVYPAARLRARPSSVGCVSAKRLSLPLTPHFFRKGPLRSTRHYRASSLLRASPPPSGPFAVIASRFPLARTSQEGFPGSSRGSVLARRPQPPRRSGPALARFFPAHGRLHPVRRTPPSRLSNEAESGSLALRLTSPPARGFNASGFPSRCSPASCCTSNYMLNSFRPPDLPDLSWRTERKERPFAALAPLWSVPNEFAMPSRKSMAEGRPKGPRSIVRGSVPGRSHYWG